MTVRAATAADAPAIAAIHSEGIADRCATFQTEPQREEIVLGWLEAGEGPLLVSERDGAVVAWARVHRYSSRRFYDGVGEYTIYVARAARGQDIGHDLLAALVAAAGERGLHKLTGLLFADNAASIALARGCGFREVGIHRRHGRLDGRWRDVLVVERLINDDDG